MKYFITNLEKNQVNTTEELLVTTWDESRDLIYKLVENSSVIGIDVETTGLDAYVNKILLVVINTPENLFCFNVCFESISNELKLLLNHLNNKNVTFLGHNIKFDYMMILIQLGIELKQLWDTTIADRKLFQGYGLDNRFWRLDETVKRHLGSISVELAQKDAIRNSFIGQNPKNIVFTQKQIDYAFEDTRVLFPLKEKLEKYITNYKMEYYIYNIHFPLIKIIAKLELRGLELDVDLVKKTLEENKVLIEKLKNDLDAEVQKLRDTLLAKDKDKKWLNTNKYNAIRNKAVVTNYTLFDEISTIKLPQGKGKGISYTNWSSSSEIIKILAYLKQPVPTKENIYVIPKIDEKGKVIKTHSFTTEAGIFSEYLLELPNSPIKNLINLILKYREFQGEINKYGEKFIAKINPVTGKIHTKLSQAGTTNGRFTSGGGSKEPDKIQSQNFPRKPHFRKMLKARKGYKFLTIDLTGAELTVMASKAKDLKLYNLGINEDLHSYMATKAWRNIFTYRAEEAGNIMDFELKEELEEKAKTFIVSKEINSELRITGKNLTFASIYNVGDKKAGKTINVTQTEGGIYVRTIREEAFLTTQMVDKNIETVIGKFKNNFQLTNGQGCIVLNERTNSRVWFPSVIDAIRKKEKLDFIVRKEAANQAANVPISGTQADMLQESMVVIDKYHTKNKLDAHILLQVHDELVIEFKEDYIEFGYAEIIKKILCDTCNLYLIPEIKMNAAYHVEDYWVK